jgi:hypothetical protein
MSPRFGDSPSVFECDHISGRFFHYAEAIMLQLADDGCFPGAGRAGHDESFHKEFRLHLNCLTLQA